VYLKDIQSAYKQQNSDFYPQRAVVFKSGAKVHKRFETAKLHDNCFDL